MLGQKLQGGRQVMDLIRSLCFKNPQPLNLQRSLIALNALNPKPYRTLIMRVRTLSRAT